MTEKHMKNYVHSLYKYKQINEVQFRNAISNLEKIREKDKLFYYFNMGKLHTAFGNVDDAILYLENAMKINPEHSATYYNLYKCYVKKKDIKKAQKYFQTFLEINTIDVNFELVNNIISAINIVDKDIYEYLNGDFSVNYTSKFGYNVLEDNSELKEIYLGVLKSFNTRNYIDCIKKLNRMKSLINKISYPMEVDILIEMLKILKDKEIACYSMFLMKDNAKDVSIDIYTNILLRLYELSYYSKKALLVKVEDIILNDSYIKGSIILDKISNIKDFEEYYDMIEYLNGIIREKSAFLSLDIEKQKDFTSKRLIAKKQYSKKQNNVCLESYLALKDEFNLPICDYYIGKLMFRIGDFKKAREYFLSYLEQGGVKAEKAYMFLGRIEKIKKNKSAESYYIHLMNRIHDTFLREFEYLPDNKFNLLKDNNYLSDDSHDIYKSKKMRIIKMQEEDFNEDNSLSIIDFDNANIDGKLVIIKNLIRSRELEKAKELLEIVKKECTPQERSKVLQFQKNKKIYVNQIRNNN